MFLLAGVALGSLAGVNAGCGDMSTSTPTTPVKMTPPPVSIGNPTNMAVPYNPTYPPKMPQVVKGGGSVLATPKIVPVFFPGEKLQTQLNTFVQSYIGQSSGYKALQEYGVGAGTVLKAVSLTQTLPASMTDVDMQNFVLARAVDGSVPVDTQTVVLLFLPSGVTVNNNGLISCVDFAGYHNDLTTTTGAHVIYAVIPRCNGEPLGTLTFAVSHELAESATDPLIASYNSLADPYFLWTLNLGGNEIGDMCQSLIDAPLTETGVGVQTRVWSNAAANAIANPCVPAPAGPGFFSIPMHTELQSVLINGVLHNIEQIPVTAGQSTTINVRLLSNNQPSPTWSVTPMEVPLPNASGAQAANALSFSWVEAPNATTASGQNGDTLHLKISAKASGPVGYTTFRLISLGPTNAGGKTETDWVGVVLVK